MSGKRVCRSRRRGLNSANQEPPSESMTNQLSRHQISAHSSLLSKFAVDFGLPRAEEVDSTGREMERKRDLEKLKSSHVEIAVKGNGME